VKTDDNLDAHVHPS